MTSSGGREGEETNGGEKVRERERRRVIDWPIQMLMNGHGKRVRSSLVADWSRRPTPKRIAARSVFRLSSLAEINKLLSKDVDPNGRWLGCDIRHSCRHNGNVSGSNGTRGWVFQNQGEVKFNNLGDCSCRIFVNL